MLIFMKSVDVKLSVYDDKYENWLDIRRSKQPFSHVFTPSFDNLRPFGAVVVHLDHV